MSRFILTSALLLGVAVSAAHAAHAESIHAALMIGDRMLYCIDLLPVPKNGFPLAEGMSTRELSQKVGVTGHIIRNYLSNIYDKLGVSSRVELALYAITREDMGSSQENLRDVPE